MLLPLLTYYSCYSNIISSTTETNITTATTITIKKKCLATLK